MLSKTYFPSAAAVVVGFEFGSESLVSFWLLRAALHICFVPGMALANCAKNIAPVSRNKKDAGWGDQQRQQQISCTTNCHADRQAARTDSLANTHTHRALRLVLFGLISLWKAPNPPSWKTPSQKPPISQPIWRLKHMKSLPGRKSSKQTNRNDMQATLTKGRKLCKIPRVGWEKRCGPGKISCCYPQDIGIATVVTGNCRTYLATR